MEPAEISAAPEAKSRGETYEGIAFTLCKAATLILILQKLALPVTAAAAALFFVLAYKNGKKDTRCVLGAPLFIAAFWGTIAIISAYLLLKTHL